MTQIFYCENCSVYCLEKNCLKCSKKTSNPCPAKYSPEDKYAKYRKIARNQN